MERIRIFMKAFLSRFLALCTVILTRGRRGPIGSVISILGASPRGGVCFQSIGNTDGLIRGMVRVSSLRPVPYHFFIATHSPHVFFRQFCVCTKKGKQLLVWTC